MEYREFRKEDFAKSNEYDYQIEYRKHDIGEGSNLIVEKKDEDGTYRVTQVPIRRFKESIFVCTDQPFDGRLIYE